MSINSKNKGARGELLWRDVLKSKGFTARRGQQYCGANGDSDVICEELSKIHFEVKFVQNFNARKALEQAKSDAKGGKMPVVVQKSAHKDWIAVMDAETFLELIAENHIFKKIEKDRYAGAIKTFGIKTPYERILDAGKGYDANKTMNILRHKAAKNLVMGYEYEKGEEEEEEES